MRTRARVFGESHSGHHLKEYIVVYITCPSRTEAEKLSRKILEKRHAASIKILNGVQALRHGRESVDQVEESLIILETQKDLLDNLTDFVQMYHSKEVPEIIAVPVIGGSKDYMNWVNAQTSDG